jgi:hypothetical protein
VVVAEGVVDLLEPVQVEQHQGHGGTGVGGLQQAGLAALVQHRAVGQPGEGVVQRLVAVLVRLHDHQPTAARQHDEEARQEHQRDAEQRGGRDLQPVLRLRDRRQRSPSVDVAAREVVVQRGRQRVVVQVDEGLLERLRITRIGAGDGEQDLDGGSVALVRGQQGLDLGGAVRVDRHLPQVAERALGLRVGRA